MADAIPADASRLAALGVGVGGQVRECVVVRALGRQLGSVVCGSVRVRGASSLGCRTGSGGSVYIQDIVRLPYPCK